MSTAASNARAYTDPGYFYKPAVDGGSEGRWFTGSPADGFGCSVCHGGKPPEQLAVDGLPPNGYVPHETYHIRIAWPEVANRTRVLYDTQAAAMLPRASLVAELISETGDDSGTIRQLPLSMATPPELCRGSQRRAGFVLYRQTLDTDPPTTLVSRCEGKNFTRCLVAVRGCGSEEVRFEWTAPSRYQGAIWFSVGFVATDLINSTPELDAVTEINIPIAPAGSSGYESELQQSCSVTSPPGAERRRCAPLLVPSGLLVGFGLWRSVKRRRR